MDLALGTTPLPKSKRQRGKKSIPSTVTTSDLASCIVTDSSSSLAEVITTSAPVVVANSADFGYPPSSQTASTAKGPTSANKGRK